VLLCYTIKLHCIQLLGAYCLSSWRVTYLLQNIMRFQARRLQSMSISLSCVNIITFWLVWKKPFCLFYILIAVILSAFNLGSISCVLENKKLKGSGYKTIFKLLFSCLNSVTFLVSHFILCFITVFSPVETFNTCQGQIQSTLYSMIHHLWSSYSIIK